MLRKETSSAIQQTNVCKNPRESGVFCLLGVSIEILYNIYKFLFSFGWRLHSHIRHLLELVPAGQKSTGDAPMIDIQENIALAPYTTMRTGGPARFFMRAITADDLSEAFDFAKEKSLPFFVLGGGSNTLVPDEGFSGLVIKIEIKGITYEDTPLGVSVVASAGEIWDDVVRDVVGRELCGIENLSLIPGTVGGAVVQNIGAYGVEARENILWVEAFDTTTGTIKIFLCNECEFGYRKSLFKKNKNLIVTRVALGLTRNAVLKTSYEDVKRYFMEKGIEEPSLAEMRSAVIAIRTAKMPAPPLGTAGSFFKNPVIPANQFEDLKQRYPEIKAYIQRDGTVKLSAAWILDKICGFRGVRRGDVGVHENQSLILVNYGTATTQNIISLASEMKDSIKEKINIDIEEEVVMMKI